MQAPMQPSMKLTHLTVIFVFWNKINGPKWTNYNRSVLFCILGKRSLLDFLEIILVKIVLAIIV